MARHVDFRDDAYAARPRVRDDVLDFVVRVRRLRRVGALFGHLGVDGHLQGPGLSIDNVPVQHVQLGQRHAVDLLVDFGRADEIPTRVDHDSAVGILGPVHDRHGLLNHEASIAVGDDELLQGGEGVQSSPDGLGRDVDGRGRCCDVEGIRLVDALLEIGRQIGNGEVDT